MKTSYLFKILLISIFTFSYSSETINNANDLCYTSSIYEGKCSAFVSVECKITTPIRNRYNNSLTDVEVVLATQSAINVDDDCGIDNRSEKDSGKCKSSSEIDLMGKISILNNGTEYAMPDYNSNEQHNTYTESTFEFMSSAYEWIATYRKNGNTYEGIINPCSEEPKTGQLDSWDEDANITTRIIKTKIISKDFNLTLASLSVDLDQLSDRDAILVKYQLYDYDKNISITDLSDWNITTSTTTKLFSNITTVHKDSRVRFRYCKEENSDTIVDYDKCLNEGYEFKTIASSDNFAIRPNKFIITPIEENLISAKDYNFSTKAVGYTNILATDYTIQNNNYNLNIDAIKYMPNGDINSSLYGLGTLNNFNFVDGNSTYLNINFDDIGKVNLKLQDRNWAIVDSDDSLADCSEDGYYICGDVNETFIPSYFVFSEPKLYNNKNATFTYIANDLNISAHITFTLTAKNDKNITTKNFTFNSWENPVDINFSIETTNIPTVIKNEIAKTQKLGFIDGVKKIDSNDTNLARNLLFNFKRDVNIALNPFEINGSDVTLNAQTVYDTKIVKAIPKVATQTVKMFYGRTNIARQRYDSNNGKAFIYYEIYCYLKDSNAVKCDKKLLPNGFSSKHSDDIRWFINEEHNSLNDGVIGVITKQDAKTIVTATTPTKLNPATTTLTYNEKYGYPYKTTMENNASLWLIYSDKDSVATKNIFSVEFEGSISSWSGIHETDSTTKDSDIKMVNRRSMW